MRPVPETRTSALREVHLRDYWKIVWQGRWTVVAVFLTVVGVIAGWTFLQAPVYRATAIVEVQPQARRLLAAGDVSGMGAAGYSWFAEEKYHATQIDIIKSRDVARRVVRLLGLENHPRFASQHDPVEAFRALIRVTPRRETGLLELSISGRDRDEITQWTNAVAHAYVDRNFEKARQNVEQSVAAIGKQMSSLSEQLSEAEESRFDALADTELFDSEKQEEILVQNLRAYSTELAQSDSERSQLEQTIRQIERLQQAGGDLLVLPELAQDEVLNDLEGGRVELERKVQSARVELRPGHPDYERLVGELRAVENKISMRQRQIFDSLMGRHEQVSKHVDYLNGQIRDAEQLSLDLAKKTSKVGIVRTEAETKRQIFDLIAKTMNEVQLSAELMTNNVMVLDDAVPPLFPVSPRKNINLVIGTLVGIFCGLATVFFLDYLDNTIRTPEDVEKYLGTSVLGVVPKIQAGTGIGQRAVEEAYQSLRTSIIFSSMNRRRKVILVTSTGPREGKSSTVSNLGRTLAAAGDRVIILDCDLRRPKQHLHFKLEREPGLTNYLAAPAEDRDWSIYVRTVEPRNLQVIPCGPIPPSPPELLSNPRFAGLLAELRERYDWVLIDSPPAASLADATLLAVVADMVVPVVQHNVTDRDHVVKTVQQLRAVNSEIPGIVLNNVDLDRAYRKDYYYAGYYYSEDDAKRSPRKRRAEPKAQAAS